ncbi:MAG: hypothetical protein CTR54_04830 [Rhizobium sp.]|nr:MAG: hypothetical protein CTR54_04830 [Rhizobium sp.]
MARRPVAAIACIFALSLPCAVRPVSADDTAANLQSMRAFLQETPDCAEFTDQCSVCRVVDGKAICSTPSTACIKKDYVCTRQNEE